MAARKPAPRKKPAPKVTSIDGFSEAALTDAFEAALEAASKAKRFGDLPFGAAVVDREGSVIVSAGNRANRTGNPTRHAEIDAVSKAAAIRGADLSDCALVSTGEPCAMCFSAAWWAGIGLIAYAVPAEALKKAVPDAMEEVLGTTESMNALVERKINLHVFGPAERKRVARLWGKSDIPMGKS